MNTSLVMGVVRKDPLRALVVWSKINLFIILYCQVGGNKSRLCWNKQLIDHVSRTWVSQEIL